MTLHLIGGWYGIIATINLLVGGKLVRFVGEIISGVVGSSLRE